MLSNAWKDYEYTQIIGDVSALSVFNDEAFDIIICHNVLEYIDDKETVVKALARVLKKDGILSIYAKEILMKHIQMVAKYLNLK
jgi:ubiquinone/menaquinone biosynthesis C-methylase UbiE